MVFCLAMKGVSMLFKRRVSAVISTALACLFISSICVSAVAAAAEEEAGQGAGDFSAPDVRGDSGTFENPAEKTSEALPVTHRADAEMETAGNEAEAPERDTDGGIAEIPEPGVPPVSVEEGQPQPVQDAKPAQAQEGAAVPKEGETAEDSKPAAGDKGDKKISLEFTDKPTEELCPPAESEFTNLDPHGVLEGYVGWKNHNRAPKEAIDNDSILPVPDRWRLGSSPTRCGPAATSGTRTARTCSRATIRSSARRSS